MAVGQNERVTQPPPTLRRPAILAASFASLLVLAAIGHRTEHVHVGAIAVVPIIFIAYYTRRRIALLTACSTGIVLGILDNDATIIGRALDLSPIIDATVLALVLCVVVAVAGRLREESTANELLRGSLSRARRAADHDPLTGIANRAYFMRSLARAAAATKPGERVVVLFCDLDRFKLVNDRYGHLVGDSVLQMAASRLANTVRSIDLAARIGGDEFGVIARHVHHVDEAAHMASQIEGAFADPFQSAAGRFDIGVTVGISMFPDDGSDAESLVRIADSRMYRAKQAKHAARVTT